MRGEKQMPEIKNVTTGKAKITGSVYRAALGTALPTDANTKLTEEFKDLGFVSEDGVVNENSPDSEDIKAWGGTIVYTSQTEKSDTFNLTLISSMDENVLKAVYGDKNVVVATNLITVKATADEQEEAVFVIEMALRGGAVKRIVIPDGKISEIGEINYNDEDLVGYEITITCMPDKTGVSHYEYILKGE